MTSYTFGELLSAWSSPSAPAPGASCSVRLLPGDNPTALQFAPPGPPSAAMAELREIDVDLTALCEALPASMPGTIGALLRFLFANHGARVRFVCSPNEASYEPDPAGYKVVVTIAGEPVEPFVRLANPLMRIRAFELTTTVPLKSKLKKVLTEWKAASGGELTLR